MGTEKKRCVSGTVFPARLTAEELVDPELAEGASHIALADLPDVEGRLHDGLKGFSLIRMPFGRDLVRSCSRKTTFTESPMTV